MRKPLFGHGELRRQTLQGQVKANEGIVQRPGWLTVRRRYIEEEVVLNDAAQHLVGFG